MNVQLKLMTYHFDCYAFKIYLTYAIGDQMVKITFLLLGCEMAILPLNEVNVSCKMGCLNFSFFFFDKNTLKLLL